MLLGLTEKGRCVIISIAMAADAAEAVKPGARI